MYNFGCSTIEVIKVICENNARPSVKRRMSFCARAKSRDLLKVPYLFYCVIYWPRKYTTRGNPHVDNSHQVWSWYDQTLLSYSVFVCRYVTWPCDLDLWPFDLEQLQCMAGHVSNLATKLEDPIPIRSWFMMYNVSRWLPLKMPTRPLRMCWITWPVSRGSKTITYLESTTPICLFTMQLLLGYDDD